MHHQYQIYFHFSSVKQYRILRNKWRWIPISGLCRHWNHPHSGDFQPVCHSELQTWKLEAPQIVRTAAGTFPFCGLNVGPALHPAPSGIFVLNLELGPHRLPNGQVHRAEPGIVLLRPPRVLGFGFPVPPGPNGRCSQEAVKTERGATYHLG